MPILERTTFFPNCRPEEVFDFCLEGLNFQAIFPEPIQPVGKVDLNDLRVALGREFQFRHWMLWCIPTKWRVRIAEFQLNHHYVDEMLNGPMKSFRHRHSVEAVPGGTRYTDRVEYQSYGGAFAEKLFVDRYMARIFMARHRNMLRLLKKPA